MNITLPYLRTDRSRQALLILGFASLPWTASSLLALDATWSGGTNSSWNTTGNWTPANIPGVNSADTATFNSAIPGSGRGGASDPILTDMVQNRAIKNILFDTSSAGAFVFGTNGGSTLFLRGNASGSITMTSTVANTQTFNSPISLYSGNSALGYSFINNASSSSAKLLINGSVTSLLAAANDNTITLGGTNTGANTISGNISGTSGAKNYSMIKNDAGTWVLSGANTMHLTSSGTTTTTVNAGTLQFAKAVALYNADTSKWTASNLNVKSGATLALNVGGTGEFTTANVATLTALGGASSGLESGAIVGLDTTNASGGNFTHTTAITNTNAGFNVISLRKMGGNTLTLTGANTYTGGTLIEQGKLAFTQDFSMGASSVNAINIANAAGTTAGVDYAQLVFSGTTLTYGGSLTLDLAGLIASNTSFDLIDYVSGSGSGNFTSVSISGSYTAVLTQSGSTWVGSSNGVDFTFDTVSGDLNAFVGTAIPEPSSWTLIVGGLALAGVLTGRRCHRR